MLCVVWFNFRKFLARKTVIKCLCALLMKDPDDIQLVNIIWLWVNAINKETSIISIDLKPGVCFICSLFHFLFLISHSLSYIFTRSSSHPNPFFRLDWVLCNAAWQSQSHKQKNIYIVYNTHTHTYPNIDSAAHILYTQPQHVNEVFRHKQLMANTRIN